MKKACHSCQVITVDVNESTIGTLKPEVSYLPDWRGLSLLLFDNQGNERLRVWGRFLDWLCLIGICPLVFLQPFVVDAFILAVLAEAASVSMQVEVLHQFLKILFCLHSLKFKRKQRYLFILISPYVHIVGYLSLSTIQF